MNQPLNKDFCIQLLNNQIASLADQLHQARLRVYMLATIAFIEFIYILVR